MKNGINRILIALIVAFAFIGGMQLSKQLEQSAAAQQVQQAKDDGRREVGQVVKDLCTYALTTRSAHTANACQVAQATNKFEYMCQTFEVSGDTCWVEDKK